MPGFDPSLYPGVQIHESAYVESPCEIGAGTKVWHFAHLMAGCKVGRGCMLGQNVHLAPGVVLGDKVKVQNNVSIYTGCILEDEVFCGPAMVFTNVATPRSGIPRRNEYQRTVVRKGATLGANCTIVGGHEIGRYAFIAAGSVVTRDVPPYALMIGVPARRSGWACRCGARLPKGAGVLTCAACGNRYRERADGLEAFKETQG
jgi:UDP-2-acetamido-3-amino-2,3-dideoxy-glucuronate N-acetyltransferase